MSQPNTKPELTPLQRKVRKLKRSPTQFLKDSKGYATTRKAAYLAWAKLGSFAIVLAMSLLVVVYYGLWASPRYVSEAQFVVKQAGSSELPIAGLAALGSVSPSMRDALVLQKYIQSSAMAKALDESVSLKAHYERTDWDVFSRLGAASTVEDYVEFYKRHINVFHDELSDVLYVEIQNVQC